MIRAALPEDALYIEGLILQLGYTISLADVIQNIQLHQQSNHCVFVYEEEKNITGFIAGTCISLFHAKETMFRITALCVNNMERNKGIGKKLVQAVENWCKKNKCYYLEVTSGPHRFAEAHVFYQQIGYTVYEGQRFIKKLIE